MFGKLGEIAKDIWWGNYCCFIFYSLIFSIPNLKIWTRPLISAFMNLLMQCLIRYIYLYCNVSTTTANIQIVRRIFGESLVKYFYIFEQPFVRDLLLSLVVFWRQLIASNFRKRKREKEIRSGGLCGHWIRPSLPIHCFS